MYNRKQATGDRCCNATFLQFQPIRRDLPTEKPRIRKTGGDVPTSSRPTFPPTSVTLVIGPLGTLATPPEPYGTHRNAQLKTEHNNPTNTRERTTRDEKQTNQNGKLQNKRRRKERKKKDASAHSHRRCGCWLIRQMRAERARGSTGEAQEVTSTFLRTRRKSRALKTEFAIAFSRSLPSVRNLTGVRLSRG